MIEYTPEIQQLLSELKDKKSILSDAEKCFHKQLEIYDIYQSALKFHQKYMNDETQLQKDMESIKRIEADMLTWKESVDVHRNNVDYIKERIKKLLIYEYQKFVLNVEPKNVCYQYLFEDSKTTEILDEFEKSKEQIMLLRDVFRTNKGQWVSLFVMHSDYNLHIYDQSAPTMTDLKNSIGQYPNAYYPQRVIHLIEEIYDVVDEDKYYPNRTRFALNIPCELRGQTTSMRDSYGDAWRYIVVGVEIGNAY